MRTPAEVRMPGDGSRLTAAAFFLDDRRAFTTFSEPDRFPGVNAFVWRTGDGGRTWQRGARIPDPPGDDAGGQFAPLDIHFLDGTTGWIVVNTVWGMFHGDLHVYRTDDGGQAFRHLYGGSTANYHGLVFIDRQRGWLADNWNGVAVGMPILRSTTDGGTTWDGVVGLPLPPPPERPDLCHDVCRVHSPFRLGESGVGFVVQREATSKTPDSASVLYLSRDGGRSWHAAALPTDPRGRDDPRLFTLEVLDDRRWWLLDGVSGRLQHTGDAGRTWAVVADLGWRGELSFISSGEGWAVATPLDADDPSAQRGLLHTLDGGVSWEAIAVGVDP